jgi:hypothetical protein
MAVLTVLGTAGVTALSYAVVAGAVYAYGSYQASAAKRAARNAFNESVRDRLVMTSTTDAQRSRVYGRVRNVDGIVYKATHGVKKEFYTFVVAVAGHEIDGFERYFFGDLLLELDPNGYVTNAPYGNSKPILEGFITPPLASGSITLPHPPIPGTVNLIDVVYPEGPDFPQERSVATTISGNVVSWSGGSGTLQLMGTYQWNQSSSKARVRGFLGTPNQNIGNELVALGISDVSSSHRFAGIACLLVTLQYDPDVFTQGVPAMSAVIRGAKVFDPRSGLTAWSENPALVARDWALYPYGGAALAAEIHEPLIIASANACDVTIPFAVPATSQAPATTYQRKVYVCGIVIPTGGDPAEALQEIVVSMAGKYAWAGGKLRIKAAYYSAPVATIDESWLSGQGDIETVSGPPRTELVNVYRPTIADQDHDYVMTPTKEVRAQAYVVLDGQELPRDLTLGAVTSFYHAQHVCGVMLRDQRQGLSLNLPLNFKAYPIELYETVAVNLPRYGWTNKEFEVLLWTFNLSGGITLGLKETHPSITDPAAQFLAQDAAPNTNLPLEWFVFSPLGLGVESGTVALSDGSIVTRVKVVWNPTQYEGVRQGGYFELQYIEAVTNPMPSDGWPSTVEDGASTGTVLTGLKSDRVYLFRLRQVNGLVRSAWSMVIAHKVAAPSFSEGVQTFYQEATPTGARDGDLWSQPSSGIIYRWNASISTWVRYMAVPAVDLVLVPVTYCYVQGNAAGKGGGSNDWDSQVFSRDIFKNAGYCSFVVVTTNFQLMVGLNDPDTTPFADPAADGAYWNIDFAFYIEANGTLSFYENGVGLTGATTVSAGDVLAIVYDGSRVNYLQNGVARRSVNTTPGRRFYFDSSFATIGGYIQNIRFAPLSSNDWSSVGGVDVQTSQIHDQAATTVFEDSNDFAGAGYGTNASIRSFTITPAAACNVEVSGYINADNVYPDAGSTLGWRVTLAGGSFFSLSDADTNVNFTKQKYVMHGTFSAAAGVSLTFSLRTVKLDSGAPVMHLFQSKLRVTQVKR